ncbi:hypothetical protein CRM22_009929 [Opisthorchis felineus]|uniref:Uncharacterized protein n=1 Tax=Opisthorchis felineus TaxID=147828 RepID=A0A4S2L451_OPIFE|nr:hypothetical protein CRM22_009929 [Opisthorchis felineus]
MSLPSSRPVAATIQFTHHPNESTAHAASESAGGAANLLVHGFPYSRAKKRQHAFMLSIFHCGSHAGTETFGNNYSSLPSSRHPLFFNPRNLPFADRFTRPARILASHSIQLSRAEARAVSFFHPLPYGCQHQRKIDPIIIHLRHPHRASLIADKGQSFAQANRCQ